MTQGSVSQWLREKMKEEGLTLRQAATKCDLSHTTIADIRNGTSPSAETIKKLAKAFGDNHHESLAVEDRLLVLSGYRSERPGEEINEPLARLLGKISGFSGQELKLMENFADYISKVEVKR